MNVMHHPKARKVQKAQQGVMLIEALIAILIFSIGVLGIIGLQGMSVKESASAGFRSEAALLANELLGRMWASDRTESTLQTAYISGNASTYSATDKTTYCTASSNGGSAYKQWAWQGYGTGSGGTETAPANGSVYKTLPNSSSYPPTVSITSSSGTTTVTSVVTIIVCWKEPGGSDKHYYMTTAQISSSQ